MLRWLCPQKHGVREEDRCQGGMLEEGRRPLGKRLRANLEAGRPVIFNQSFCLEEPNCFLSRLCRKWLISLLSICSKHLNTLDTKSKQAKPQSTQ